MTNEEAKKAGFRTASGALYVYWCIENGHIYVRSCDACALTGNDFPTRAKAREALRKCKLEASTKPFASETPSEKDARIKALVNSYKTKGGPITKEQLTDEVSLWCDNHNISYYNYNRLGRLGSYWNKPDAEHAKWLTDMQSQTTPITPEQAKMLSRDDVVFMYDIASLGIGGIRGDTAIKDNSYVTSPLFFTEQAARDRLNEVIAEQAALDKAKAEAEPLEWCERGHGEHPWPSDQWTWCKTVGLQEPATGVDIRDQSDQWMKEDSVRKSWDPYTFVGKTSFGDLILRVRYRNPLWLANHGKAVESHETPVGETQTKEVVTDETQAVKPTTVRGWLETIPDPAIRAAAIRQCEDWDKNCTNLARAITELWSCGCTDEGPHFWFHCLNAASGADTWPVYPAKAKQEADGWTQYEIDKAALKPDAVSHPSHYTSHPSGVECITITKHMNFCRGNAVKYLWRAGQKGDSLDKEIEDIAKAEEYCRIEKERLIATKGEK